MASVVMERMRQRSSTTEPMCSNSSQISAPDFPNFLNLSCGPFGGAAEERAAVDGGLELFRIERQRHKAPKSQHPNAKTRNTKHQTPNINLAANVPQGCSQGLMAFVRPN